MIRDSVRSDFPMVEELVLELYNTLDNTNGMDKHLAENKFERILTEPRIHIMVADAGGLVVGYLTMNINDSLLDAGPTAIIHELAVRKGYRGKGIGKTLVASALEKCKHLGCSEIGVGTEASNDKARKFYRACGFSEIGVILEKHLK